MHTNYFHSFSRKTWAGRIGFEPQRCYGDITLRFQFIPDNLSQTQRNAFSRDFDPADPSNLEEICIAQESSQDEQASDSEMGYVKCGLFQNGFACT